MRDQRGQSTVEWTGLLLLVAAAFSATAMAAHAVGGGGLPQRLVCAIAGRECAPRRVFTAADFRPPHRMRAARGGRDKPYVFGGLAARVPAPAYVAGAPGVACLLAARREGGALAWMLAALGATLAVCAAVALA